MSKKLDLLSARNLITTAAAVLLLSVLGMCLAMLRPHDSGGLGRDSFGTRGAGYRALIETLEGLGVNVSRSLSPPQPEDRLSDLTLVMLSPDARLVAVGPKYLNALGTWIEGGGRLVVTPSSGGASGPWVAEAASRDPMQLDVLDAIGIEEEVSVGEVPAEPGRADSDFSWSSVWEARNQQPPPRVCEVALAGSLSPLAKHVRELALPSGRLRTLRANLEELDGSLVCADEDGERHLLVAVVRRGAGQIVVLAEPAVVSNRLIARSDNSVLAAHLIAPSGNKAVFDEFYHGLAVRGNPLYLLTRPGFAVVTTALLLVVGTRMWRAAVFLGPPLSDSGTKRRDIGEYVSAMAEFFSHGSGSRRFILREVRDGVLRQICQDLRLPMDTLELDTVATALARRDSARAQRLVSTIREVDAALASSAELSRADFLSRIQRLSNCL